MIVLFFTLWIFGAVLLLSCSALVWSERITVLQTLPACAKCGYSLIGLPRNARCPECGDIWRKFTTGRHSQVATSDSVMLWVTPTICGGIAAAALTVVAGIGAPDNTIGLFTITLPFLAMGVLVRVLLKWITLTVARTMMWCGIASLWLVLAGIMADAATNHDFTTTILETYRIAPLMIVPFAGYGLAIGIGIIAWLRSRPVRMPKQVRARQVR